MKSIPPSSKFTQKAKKLAQIQQQVTNLANEQHTLVKIIQSKRQLDALTRENTAEVFGLKVKISGLDHGLADNIVEILGVQATVGVSTGLHLICVQLLFFILLHIICFDNLNCR